MGETEDEKFYFVLTVDVEPGYLRDSGRVRWINQDNRAFVGVNRGLKNIKTLLDKYKIPATFFVTPQCFYPRQDLRETVGILQTLEASGSEIGLHMHPREDEVLQSSTGKQYQKTSSHHYNRAEIEAMLQASRDIFAQHLGGRMAENMTSLRWGNWGLSTRAVGVLEKNGFTLDSSACPGISGHINIERHYDWERVGRLYPWKLSKTDYQDTTTEDSNIWEIPNTTFKFLGKTFRADPVLGNLFSKAYEYYYEIFSKTRRRIFFVTLTHSSEATYADGRPTRTLKSMGKVIEQTVSQKVKFITLTQARELL